MTTQPLLIDRVYELGNELDQQHPRQLDEFLRRRARVIGAELTEFFTDDKNASLQVELEDGKPNWNVAIHQLVDGQTRELPAWMLAGVLAEGLVVADKQKRIDSSNDTEVCTLHEYLANIAIQIQELKCAHREQKIQSEWDFKNRQ